MHFHVLGEVSATRQGVPVELPAGKPRLMLAVLLAHAGQPAPTTLLVDALWGTSPPASARRNLHLYAHRLRRAIGDQRIPPGPPRCALVAGDVLDVQQFRELGARGAAALGSGDADGAFADLGSALQLWTGPAFGDLAGGPVLEIEARRLEEERIVVVEHWAEAGLRRRTPDDLMATLVGLVAANPYRERIRGHLMRALYQAGRQAESLEVYRQTRALFNDQLGVEPGEELQRVHAAILRHDDAAVAGGAQPAIVPDRARTEPRPRELPAGVVSFTGRGEPLRQLDAWLDRADDPAASTVVTIVGTAGVGKTALAVHWAHRVAARFPDGQLFVNLQGFDPSAEPMPASEAARGFLQALHVAPDRIPPGLSDRTRLLRSILADRRMLVVLDNARDAEQARSLMPGAPGCFTVVTSRNRMPGLTALNGAHTLTLGALDPDEAELLMSARLGDAHAATDRAAVRDLVQACARLPLALVIVAGRATTGRVACRNWSRSCATHDIGSIRSAAPTRPAICAPSCRGRTRRSRTVRPGCSG